MCQAVATQYGEMWPVMRQETGAPRPTLKHQPVSKLRL